MSEPRLQGYGIIYSVYYAFVPFSKDYWITETRRFVESAFEYREIVKWRRAIVNT